MENTLGNGLVEGPCRPAKCLLRGRRITRTYGGAHSPDEAAQLGFYRVVPAPPTFALAMTLEG